jgi:hypothetical protein
MSFALSGRFRIGSSLSLSSVSTIRRAFLSVVLTGEFCTLANGILTGSFCCEAFFPFKRYVVSGIFRGLRNGDNFGEECRGEVEFLETWISADFLIIRRC